VLEVLEDPLPALLLVGRAGGGCAARFRRHVPAAASLPPSLPSLAPSLTRREWSEKANGVWLLEFFSTEVVLVVERERKAGGDDERGRGHLPGMGIEISNSTGAETWNRTRAVFT
jgi:hypothetical protein